MGPGDFTNVRIENSASNNAPAVSASSFCTAGVADDKMMSCGTTMRGNDAMSARYSPIWS
ncbi:MAG: hypothetical protein AUH41_01365 [Gemmatimonadetes bacterium 13_1_40CM_66_11]|nr:MAG: hypothetical protein AUH41_01365 [Gemmatimonadetes bacterium 13_1_40CM_66_11]